MNKKNLLKFITTVSIMISIIILMVTPIKTLETVEAVGPSFDVLGYAWSNHPYEQNNILENRPNFWTQITQTGTQGFGWISLSGTNPGAGGGTYQVKIDPITGKFSGYAWSEQGGWIDFAPTGPFPVAAGTTPQSAFIDPSCLADKTATCSVKGWIRFVEGANGNSSWDGWVNMEIFNTITGVYDLRPYQNTSTFSGVKLLPEQNGIRKFSGYAWGDDLSGMIGFDNAKIQLTDVCPDTKFNGTGNPKNGTVDPKTAGTQTTLPAGYALNTTGTMCAIFGCTDKTAANFVKGATVDDGSCLPAVDVCPDTMFDLITDNPGRGYTNGTYIPATVGIQTAIPSIIVNGRPFTVVDGRCAVFGCTDTSSPNYFKGAMVDDGSCIASPVELCPDGSVPPNGDVTQCDVPPSEDQCRNIEGFQDVVRSPYTQVVESGIKNCYIIGCMDPNAKNWDKNVTMQSSPNTCEYDPGVEICWNNKDDNGNGKVDENCPVVPTKHKKPGYVEI